MATLYVENVPGELYEALRKRARRNRKSMAAELIALLEENLPTAEQRAARRKLLERALEIRRRRPRSAGPFPTAEEMLREDRRR